MCIDTVCVCVCWHDNDVHASDEVIINLPPPPSGEADGDEDGEGGEGGEGGEEGEAGEEGGAGGAGGGGGGSKYVTVTVYTVSILTSL